MKNLVFIMISLIILLLLPSMARATEITVQGDVYEIAIPDNLEDFEVVYLRAMEAYIGESKDFSALKDSFDEYQDQTEETLLAKDTLILSQKKLIIVKDRRIEQLEAKKLDAIAYIPSAYYSFSESGHGGGVGLGVLLFESFFAQVQGGYPWEIQVSVGWKF